MLETAVLCLGTRSRFPRFTGSQQQTARNQCVSRTQTHNFPISQPYAKNSILALFYHGSCLELKPKISCKYRCFNRLNSTLNCHGSSLPSSVTAVPSAWVTPTTTTLRRWPAAIYLTQSAQRWRNYRLRCRHWSMPLSVSPPLFVLKLVLPLQTQ